MRILLSASQAPFLRGGAELHADNLHAALDSSYADAMAREADTQRAMRRTGDSMEGGLAFLQKRKAEFKGH